MLEAFCEMLPGQDAWDARCGKRKRHLAWFKLLRRAQLLGVPKAKVVAFVQCFLAQVIASYPNDATFDRPLTDEEIAAERAASDLTSAFLRGGAHPSPSDCLTILRDARRLEEEVLTIEAKIDRELGRAPRRPELVRT